MPKFKNDRNGDVVEVSDKESVKRLRGLDNWSEVKDSQSVEIPEGSPAEEWTVAQLKAYAERENIDLGDVSKKADVLDAIAKAQG
jgi:hypothetical protein